MAGLVKIARNLAKPRGCAVGQQSIDPADVVHHVAIAQGARAAAVVGGHAADRGAARRRRVDRKEQFVLPQRSVEAVEHHPRLDPRPAPFDIDRDDPVHISAAIEDKRTGHGLPALRGAGAARQNRHAFLAGDRDRRRGVLAIARDHDAQRLDLIDRRVGGVAPAAERVEQDLAADLAAQPRLETRCGVIIKGHRQPWWRRWVQIATLASVPIAEQNLGDWKASDQRLPRFRAGGTGGR